MNNSRARLNLVGIASLLLMAVSCSTSKLNRAWDYSDLRAINQHEAAMPSTDILAVYTRTTDLSVDIRVDLLDINIGDQYRLKLTLWDDRDFSRDALVIDIPSSGVAQTSGGRTGKPNIWPRIIEDDNVDTLTISLNRAFIGNRYRLDVSTFTTDTNTLADEELDIRSDGQPPAHLASLVLAFRDAFPAATPAQALRRWAGAHTGPLGDRHGLKYVLDGARQSHIPLVLLDLKNPASLAALDFMGNLQAIQDLYGRGLLILPEVAVGEPAQIALELNRATITGFGLPKSSFVYAGSSSQARLPGYRAQFVELTDGNHVAISGGTRLIPLPSTNPMEATANGPSLEIRRILIDATSAPEPGELVVLGGSLPNSTWGDSDMAAPTFEWIAAHPWIRPLTGQELLGFPAHDLKTTSSASVPKSPWLEALQKAPKNAITQSAWQTYLALVAFTPDTQLQALRSAYLGQLGELLAAADWAQKPTARADCSQDLNMDGRGECVLANQTYLAIFESAGARLTQFFYVDANGPHQLVAPTFQFAVGLSDPSEWRPETGEAADPNGIPGAFSDAGGEWADFTPTLHANEISFTSPDGKRTKTYRLTGNGIDVHYQGWAPVSTRIPLTADPQMFYAGPTHYQATLTARSWIWSLAGASSTELRTSATLSAQGFTSAIPFLSLSEDPNLGYPQGNYLPFPLSLVTIQGNGEFDVQINQK